VTRRARRHAGGEQSPAPHLKTLGLGSESFKLDFHQMDEATARIVLAWRYEGLYAFYNSDPAEAGFDLQNLTDPQNFYFSVTDESGLTVAHFCYGHEARVPGGKYFEDALDIGCGLRPDLTGRGAGALFIRAGLEFARERFRRRAFRASVAAFNERALHSCEKVGFRRARTFRGGRDDTEFVILLLDS
jgi:[ribosomal protein S18]-alanine N-acetyltransferase